jgi:mono/diheme cytochrome c family protein
MNIDSKPASPPVGGGMPSVGPQKTGHAPAQERENADPSERVQPMPLLAAAVTLVMVLFGAGYVLMSDPFGDATLGDRRTVADLRAAKPGAPGAPTAAADGKAIFTGNCVACHQATGKGLPGLFPPLDGSEWVRGDERTVINILLHGISGEIEVLGASYKGVMPPFKQLSDAEIAAVATHIRSQWSNTAKPITTDAVTAERKVSTRDTPFDGGAALKALAAPK